LKYAEQYLKMVKDMNIHVDKAFMFGSYAKGSAHKYSDIDIAIISKDFSSNPLFNRKLLSSLSLEFSKVEAHLFSWSDYKGNVKDAFLTEEIMKTGIEIKVK